MGAMLLAGLFLAAGNVGQGASFERLALSERFFCEGAGFADLDRDGHADVVAGPHWYPGPHFREARALYAGEPVDPRTYSNHFFTFPYDFDGDSWTDVLVIGFPGRDARWYENPGPDFAQPWEAHVAYAHVDNESPTFADLTGDGRPEIVCHAGGRFGWLAWDPAAPRAPWVFHPLSPDLGLGNFVHGLGLGDVDGDGRLDLLEKDGWWRQPASLAGDPAWERHPVAFARGRIGGAQMHVVDVDGDGDGDVVTSLDAHGFGLSWFEQVRAGEERTFVEHVILDQQPEQSPFGLVFSELHALALADVDADGLQDLVTGRRWWAHGPDGPEPDAPAVLYWFRLERGSEGARFVPHLIDADSGVGTQLTTGDVDGDGRVDVVVGNKKGAFVFLNRLASDGARLLAPDPPPRTSAPPAEGAREDGEEQAVGELPRGDDGAPLNLDFERGDLSDWTLEGEAYAGQPVRGDTVSARGREPSGHQGEFWVGGYELAGDEPRGTLTSTSFEVTQPWASFLLGGGSYVETRLELWAEGEAQPFSTTSAGDHETLQRVVVDLQGRQGQRIFVRLVDDYGGGWGHLNFDDFRFHAAHPSFELPPGAPALLPADLVPHAGLAPRDAQAAMSLPAGFEVDLVAAEPDVHQPIALALDAKGRLWVVEAHSYPEKRPEGEGRDLVLVFEDEDHDGAFEKRTVFASGLNLVSGLELGFGGAWIGAAPELLFVPDADDDLVPDGPAEVVLDGWGFDDTHETLNAFQWGPDGWLYGCHGVFTHSRVGAPGTPDDERVPLDAAIWRLHPARKSFEVFAWGTSNPWGVDFDDRGQAFCTACVIPHLFHVIQGARYERQAGSHFDPATFGELVTIADHRHFLGADPHAGNHHSNDAGGGHAHCGALVYLGDQFPERYRGSVFMNNIHGNRVNNDLLERRGSGFVGRHGDDFLLANDAWFRGVALRSGPEGALYVSDWYDQQACHDRDVELWDRSNGRIYRVSYGAHRPLAVDLAALPSAELVRLQLHPNDWFVRRARLILQERGHDAAVRRRLTELLREPRPERERLRLLWALHATQGLEEGLARALLGDEHEAVRAWTIQLELEDRAASPAVRADLERLARMDPSPMVRLYLASGLQRLPLAERWPVAEALAAHAEDADDPNLPLMLWYGVMDLVPEDPARALALARASRLEVVARFVVRRAAQDPAAHGALVAALSAERDVARRRWMLAEMSTALADQLGLARPDGWPAIYAELRGSGDPELAEQALSLAAAFGDETAFPELRALVADRGAGAASRRRALEALARAGDGGCVPVVQGLLDEPELRGDALRSLERFDDARTPALVLARWAELGADERRDALGLLSSRAAWAGALLDALGRGDVARTEIGAFVLRKLHLLRDEDLARRVADVWGVYRESAEDKAARVSALRAELDPERLAQADLPRGRDLYARNCQQCHVLFGTGGTLGPELTGSNRADLDYVLTNLVDPSELIGKDYQVTMAWLRDGRLVTGIENARTDSAITLALETGSEVVSLAEVEELRLSELSTMPEGLLDPLTPDEVRDLVAYLASPVQVPRLATSANAAELFDGRSLAGWQGDESSWLIEDGEIVGRTSGLDHNEFLKSELEVRDFRLTLEVRLAANAGNSGIQFRSSVLPDGAVAGYQADIGDPWWGMLYEEQGRGLLWDRSGQEFVRLDNWNTYEVLALGPHVRTWLNGRACVDVVDPDGARAGILALQLHSGGPTEIRFRNLKLEVDPAPPGGGEMPQESR